LSAAAAAAAASEIPDVSLPSKSQPGIVAVMLMLAFRRCKARRGLLTKIYLQAPTNQFSLLISESQRPIQQFKTKHNDLTASRLIPRSRHLFTDVA
jgi:hypothetical protein